ncbi:MAG: hypothetical protein J5747_06615 [Spirochaetaceae bacterium]|nr:hypothetical protein [Spirochaetaceae bacterium]
MVNVFIIHSKNDHDFVKNTVEPYICGQGKTDNNANILSMPHSKCHFWKHKASKKIKSAQVIILIIGNDANDKTKKKTIGLEVKKALKFNKQIYIYNIGNYPIPEYLYYIYKNAKQSPIIPEPTDLEKIKERIDNFSNGNYNIFSNSQVPNDPIQKQTYNNNLMEQYKMFQKTSEDLVARRQSVNSFYISLNTALVTFIGVILGLINSPLNTFVMMAMCIAGIILDIAWVNLLDSYGVLNSAKMKVISLLEEQLPIALYDSEWKIMTDKLNNKKYVSFTDSEKKIPKTFGVVYCIILIICILYLLSF